MTSTMSSVPPPALEASGRCCGQRQELLATSGLCRETGQARLPLLTMLATWLDTPKVRAGCARLYGLMGAECRSLECFPAVARVEHWPLAIWVRSLGVRRARLEITHLY